MSDEGFDELDAMLDRMQRRGRDLRPFWRGVAGELRDRERALFDAGGAGLWPPLQRSTLRQKRGGRILVETGALLASLTRRGDRYAREQVTATTLTFGTRDPVANLLRRGVRGAPERDPLPAPTDLEQHEWADSLLDHLTGA